MDIASQLKALIEAATRLGVAVRSEKLGGSGGGLCGLRGEKVLFLDLDTDRATRVECCLQALATLPRTEDVFLPPALREPLDRKRKMLGTI